jgi:hypothetical protein
VAAAVSAVLSASRSDRAVIHVSSPFRLSDDPDGAVEYVIVRLTRPWDQPKLLWNVETA